MTDQSKSKTNKVGTCEALRIIGIHLTCTLYAPFNLFRFALSIYIDFKLLFYMVGMEGFEPSTPASRMRFYADLIEY